MHHATVHSFGKCLHNRCVAKAIKSRRNSSLLFPGAPRREWSTLQPSGWAPVLALDFVLVRIGYSAYFAKPGAKIKTKTFIFYHQASIRNGLRANGDCSFRCANCCDWGVFGAFGVSWSLAKSSGGSCPLTELPFNSYLVKSCVFGVKSGCLVSSPVCTRCTPTRKHP